MGTILLLHILAGGLGLLSGYVALYAAKGGRGAGMAYPLFLFGGIGLTASVGDRRMIRAGGVRGASRLARHLWRMCFALFIASIAFFLGRGRVPEAIRTPALLAIGVLAPLVAMLYWLRRVRIRKTFLGIAGVSTPQATAIKARASL